MGYLGIFFLKVGILIFGMGLNLSIYNKDKFSFLGIAHAQGKGQVLGQNPKLQIVGLKKALSLPNIKHTFLKVAHVPTKEFEKKFHQKFCGGNVVSDDDKINLSSKHLLSGNTIKERFQNLLLKGSPYNGGSGTIVPFSLHGIPFSLILEWDQEKEEGSIRMPSYDKKGQESRYDCLNLNVISGSRELAVSNINTRGNNCQLPSKVEGKIVKKGDFVLDVIDYLASGLEAKSAKLVDASKVICQSQGQLRDYSLRFLKMMEKGKTWYQAHGYLPEKMTFDSYQEKIQKLRSMDIHQVWSDVLKWKKEIKKRQELLKNYYKDFSNYKNENNSLSIWKKAPRDAIQEIQKIQELGTILDRIETLQGEIEKTIHQITLGEPTSLAQFIPKLWQTNCSQLVEMSEIFFTQADPVNYGEWFDLYSDLHWNSMEVVKEFEK